jgi:hypothetical protein
MRSYAPHDMNANRCLVPGGVLSLLLLWQPAAIANADPSFAGTWVIQPELTTFELRSTALSLEQGVFHRTDCRGGPIEVPADGADHSLKKKRPFFDAVSVRVLDQRHVEIVEKRQGTPVWKGDYLVSRDLRTLTLEFEDHRGTLPVTGTLEYSREGQPGPGGPPLSGTWRPTRLVKLSPSGRSITFDQLDSRFVFAAGDGRSAAGKVDAQDYPLRGYLPGATMSVNRLSPDTVQINRKQDGELVEMSRLILAADGERMDVRQIDWLCQSEMRLTLNKQDGGS